MSARRLYQPADMLTGKVLVSWDDYSQLNGKIKNAPNHQPVYHLFIQFFGASPWVLQFPMISICLLAETLDFCYNQLEASRSPGIGCWLWATDWPTMISVSKYAHASKNNRKPWIKLIKTIENHRNHASTILDLYGCVLKLRKSFGCPLLAAYCILLSL